MPVTVLGLRIKSGWAAAALVKGPLDRPQVVDVRRVELSDPDTPQSLQPYHAGFGKPQSGRRAVERLVRLVERCARRNVAALLDEYRRRNDGPRLAAVVATSLTDPSTITNEHIRIHALEGQLFRRVAMEAAVANGLKCTGVLERELRSEAAAMLGKSPEALRRDLASLRDRREGLWRAEFKSAALAAWIHLPRR